MKVSLIIPTKNESGAIGKVLKEIPKEIIHEIIVVDANSTDTTATEAKNQLRPGKDTFFLQRQRGFGNALREAFKIARGDVIVVMDGDGSHNPKNISLLLKKIDEGYTYVIASRYTHGGGSNDDTLVRFVGNKLLTFITNIRHGTNVSDGLYFFTAIKSKDLKKLHLTSTGFELCIELLIKAHRSGLKFAEIPVIERTRYAGKSKVNAFVHGIKILGMILSKY